MPEQDLHAVVTRVTPVRKGGRVVVHAYGPYPKMEAIRVKAEFLREARQLGYSNRLECNICKLLGDV